MAACQRAGPTVAWIERIVCPDGRQSPRMPREQPLLGGSRVTDLAVNVVLPWLWSRASEGQNGEMNARLERRYFGWPPSQDNAVLRLARQRLLGSVARSVLPSAAAQQGLIQLVRDYCDHSDATCKDCKMEELVKGFLGKIDR